MYNELLLEGGRIFYKEEHDGGGSTFGINSLKDDEKLKIESFKNFLEKHPDWIKHLKNYYECDYFLIDSATFFT